jgi:ribonuclease HII
VGRGPVAGPVAVCVCAMSISEYRKMSWDKLNDSKKMSLKLRELWSKEACKMKKDSKLKFSVIYRSAIFIDKKGISVAIKSSIEEGLQKLNLKPNDCQVLLDGSLKAPKEYKNQKTIIKGDQKEKIISLASVVAKVDRDKKMNSFHKKYPQYLWSKNKGYGTREHYRAIRKNGLTILHRKSFLASIGRRLTKI